MKRFNKNLQSRKIQIQWFLIVFSIFTLTACGGGGGGSGGAPVSYAGKTTQAKVTEENSGTLASDALNFGQGRGGTIPFNKPAGAGTTNASIPKLYELAQRAITKQSNAFSANKPVGFPEEVESGECGGRSVINGTVDDENGDFDITVRFENFCEGGWTFSGNMTVQGNGNSRSLTITVNNLTVSDGTVSTTMDGTMTANVNSLTSSSMTMDIAIRDNGSGRTFKLENYSVSSRLRSGAINITISGRFYNPEEGYIDLSTPQTLRILSGDLYPSSGILEAQGSDGTKTRLTALSATQFQLQVDADGDGVFESSTVGEWADLGEPIGA